MLSLKIFNKLKKIHLNILNQEKIDPQTISNEYLFINRFHPELIKRYFFLKNLNFFQKIRSLSNLFQFRNNFFKIDYYKSYRNLKKNKILFISALDNEKFINRENQHLNELIKIFKDDDYIEIVKSDFDTNANKKIKKNKYNRRRIFLNGNIGFFREIKLLISHFYSFYKNKKKYSKNKNNFEKDHIKKIFSFDAFLISVKNYKYYIQLSLLFKILEPKIIFFPYEGFAWERLVVNAAKTNDIKVECIGYQRSIITKYSYLIKFNFNNSIYNPDRIICKSKINCKKLLSNSSIKKNQVIVSGNLLNINFKIKKVKKKFGVLVLPESWEVEEKRLFLFTQLCAKKYPQINFIFRPHPMSIKSITKLKTKNLKNFFVSENTFKKDLENNNIVFFRGSYAAIKACAMGLFPIYVKFKNDFDADINPIYELEKLIFKITDPKELRKIIQYLKQSKSNKRKIYIMDHCLRVDASLNKRIIKKLIKTY